jgi:hypothetical protein
MTPLLPDDRSRDGRLFHHPILRYRIILHRTPGKELMFIVRTVMELTHFGRAEAVHRMWESYHWDRSQVLVTHLERAELYLEQFADRGLNVSLEPAGLT